MVSASMLQLIGGAEEKSADPPGGPPVGWRMSLSGLFT